MKKMIHIGTAAALGLFAFSGIALADTSNSSFSLNVPGGNRYVETGYSQTKTTSGANGSITISTGSQACDARMVDAQGNAGAWVRQIKAKSTSSLPGHYKQVKGDKMKMGISSNWNATQQSKTGSWRSN